jgi:membrane-associated phospholipid phosphatase
MGFMAKTAAIVMLVFAAGALGRVDANSPAEKGWDAFTYSFDKDVHLLPDRVWNEGGEALINMPALTALGIAGAAGVFLHNTHVNGESIDEHVAHHYNNHPGWSSSTDEYFQQAGNPGTHFAITGVWYAWAAANKDDLNRERAWTMMTALSISGITTVGLKVVVNNRTPNDKSFAWPSGHTASSFTVASVLDEFYGPGVGIPAYLGASFIGYRMIASGDHWTSDVLFGGVLGFIVGHSVAGNHMKMEVAGCQFEPMVTDSGAMGIALVKDF